MTGREDGRITDSGSAETAGADKPGGRLGGSPLRRLLRHLRRGGSRKGACGWAGLSHTGLLEVLENNPGLAAALERAEALGLARDERRLDLKVREGDREALLFRMKNVYGYGSGTRGREEAQPTGETFSREFTEVAAGIRSLGKDGRRELAGAYRESAGA
jgi:hypothetical protein